MIHIVQFRAFKFAAVCALLLSSVLFYGQESRRSDTEQITALMKGLADHSVKADDVVDPKLGGPERKKSLDYFSDPSYQLTLIPTEEIRVQPDGHATVPVRVHFKNLTGAIDANVDVKFIQRDGVWYFADFDFLGWSTYFIVTLIFGMSIGIALGAGILILRSRLSKQGKLKGANLIKIFIPIFWPKLFSESRPPA